MTSAAQVAELLERERTAIRRGDYVALASLVEEKASLFAAFERESKDDQALTSLKQMAEYNNALLEAARRGFGAALTQIGEARAAASPQTYGPKGERDRLGPGARQVEKRY